MNVANSKVLLTAIAVLFFALNLSATIGDIQKEKLTSKDIIIVNVDPDLPDQLSALAEYTYDLYISNNKGKITIKKYLGDDVTQSEPIAILVDLITELGVSAERIVIVDEELKLDHPYFTLSVREGPNVQ